MIIIAADMISFFVTFLHLLRGLRVELKNPDFRALLWVVCLLLLTGTFFYTQVEGWRWLDSLYFCVITLTTIGYGDFSPKTDLGKIFTIFYIIIGMGTLLSFITIMASHARKYNPVRDLINGVDELWNDPKKTEH